MERDQPEGGISTLATVGSPPATLAPYPNPPYLVPLTPAMPSPKDNGCPSSAKPRRPRLQRESSAPGLVPCRCSPNENRIFSHREVLRPRKQATAMKTPLKTPVSPRVFWELPRLANRQTGNFLLLAKMQPGTFFRQTGNFLIRPLPAGQAPTPSRLPEGRASAAKHGGGREGRALRTPFHRHSIGAMRNPLL